MKNISRIAFVALMAGSVVGCASVPETKSGVDPQKVASVTKCVRTKPVGQFDENCDEPKLGWKGANGGDFIIIQGGGISGSIAGF